MPTPRLIARLGFPAVGAHRRFVTAIGIDALGSGVYMPVAVLYLLKTTDLTLAEVGTILSLSAVVAFPFVLVVGSIVDRIGAKRVILGANVALAVGYVVMLTVTTYAQAVVAAFLLGLGQSAFWGAYAPLVAAISAPGERELWFGFLGSLRNIGFAVGGLLASIMITIGTVAAYRGMAAANALSFVVSFILLAGLKTGGRTRDGDATPHDSETVAGAGSSGGWGVVLRDTHFHLVSAATTAYALCSLALNFAIPVYIVEILELPGWVTGGVFTLNTVMVGFGQSALVRQLTGRLRYRVVGLAYAVYAVGFVGLAVAGALPVGLAVVGVFLAGFVYTIGEMLGGPVLGAIAVDARPATMRGRYMSMYQMSWTVASMIAPAAFGWLLTHGRWPVWCVLVGVCGVGALLAQAMPARLPVAALPITNASDAADPADPDRSGHAEAEA